MPEAEPDTDDWFASLAAVIGGTMPVSPPPDNVLADELERALLGHSDEAASPPPAVVAGDRSPPPAPVPIVVTASPAPTPAEPVTNYKLPLTPAAAPEPKTADRVLAEAIASRSVPVAPSALSLRRSKDGTV